MDTASAEDPAEAAMDSSPTDATPDADAPEPGGSVNEKDVGVPTQSRPQANKCDTVVARDRIFRANATIADYPHAACVSFDGLAVTSAA